MNDILPPTDDWIFKLLFGDERNKSMLIDLLRSFLELPNEEYELDFLDTSLKPETEEDKLGILDIKVKTGRDWLQFLRAKRKEEFEMVAEKNPEIRKAVNTLYELSADERTRAEYEMHMKAIRDKAWFEDNALQKGRQEGLQMGLQKTYELASLIKSGKTPDEAMTLLGL